MELQVFKNLDQVMKALRSCRRWTALLVVWSLTAVVAVVAWWMLTGSTDAGGTPRTIGTLILMSAGLFSVWQFRTRRGTTREEKLEVARLIETEFPDLNQRLLTTIEQLPDQETGRFSWLQRQLANEVGHHATTNEWQRVVPPRRILTRLVGALCALAITLYFGNELRSPDDRAMASSGATGQEEGPIEAAPGSGVKFDVTVVPGTTEVERGTSLLITARFEGPLPADVTLSQKAGQETAQIPMQKSLKDPLFGFRMPAVSSDFQYTIRYDEHSTETFSISVYELPVVERVDARIEFPSYTEMKPELIEDTWRVSAVEGSTAVLFCRLNKDLKQGELVREDGERFPLKRISAEEQASLKTAKQQNRDEGSEEADSNSAETIYAVRVPVDRTARFEFDLFDTQERANRDRGEFQIVAYANRPPDLKLVFPAKDMQVSPIEEIELEATVWDDFGVKDHGFVVAVGDQKPKSVSLGDAAKGRKKHKLAHLVELELAKAEPDQLVSYYFFADDVDASGQTRRTMSDMFFAEVRHFEEIFREGQAQSAQQQQQQQQQQQGEGEKKAEELAKLQKQILNATWKIIRREMKAEVSQSFAEDVQLLVESQQQAIEKLQELMEELKDAQSKQYAEAVGKAMNDAVTRLTEALDNKSAVSLTPAMSAERSAYQGLLKLRAREHEVTQQQQSSSSSSSSSSSPSQQQMQQLELDNKKNRYEEQNQARQQQSAQQQQQNREQLQVLNRLRELASRQGDMNKKVRELEHALREAKTDKEREELERQLKKLRDEQRELLKDFDEVKERMEQPENQQQMAEQQQQLDDARSRARQASEALEKGQLSQALNQGTRAERELEKLRDEVRQKAAGQFGEAMQDLRQQAQEITERQDDIKKALTKKDDEGPKKSLRGSTDRKEVEEQLETQRDQLDQVLTRMEDVVREAEANEPLLARQLYETVRKARSDRPGEILDETRDLVKRGFLPQATEAEKKAAEGVERVAQGIEKAADSVLGNELDSLKRAKNDAEQAAEAIAKELAEANPNLAQPRRNNKPGEQVADANNQKPGQNPNGKPGEQTPNGQPGEQKPAENNPRGNPPEGGITNERGKPGEQPQPGQNPNGKPGENPRGQKPGEGTAQNEQRQSTNTRPTPGKPGESNEQRQSTQQRQNGDQPGAQPKPGEASPNENPRGQRPGENPQPGKPGENPQPGQQSGEQKGDNPQGKPGEQKPGEQPGKPGEQPGQKPGQQPGEQPGQKPGEQPGKPGQQPSNNPGGQPGQQPGQTPGQPGSNPQGQPSGSPQPGQPGQRSQPGLRSQPQPGSQPSQSEQGGNQSGPGAPLTGPGFVEWSDQLRNIEETLTDPKLRAEVARIREEARSMRIEFKRHSKEPEWNLVKMKILDPLDELQKRLKEEIAKRESPDSLVPIDRDPVPDRYADMVRKYYERIGSGK
jgi:hypothetical protein